MQFEINTEFLEQVHDAIQRNDIRFLSELTHDLFPADIAEILNRLELDDAKKLYNFLEEEVASEVLVELDEDVREKILESLSSKEIAEKLIDNLQSDEAADVIAELPDEKQDEVLSHIEDEEQASDIVDLMNYDKNTAGGLMQKELVAVNANKTMLECVRELRKHADHIEDVYAVYVVDDDEKLLGVIPIKMVLTTSLRSRISDVYDKDIISVRTSMPAEEVAGIMEKYDLIYVPVVDGLGKLVGRITIDDVVDVIKEEAEKDIQMMSGITEDVEHSDKIWMLSRSRIPWLLVGLVGGIFGSQVIEEYEGQIRIHPEMAFFMPLIAAMGGNAGVQSSAIVVQGIANKTLMAEGILRKLGKEFTVGLLNGMICAVLILGYNLFFSDSMALSITVSVALLSVIVFATLFGTFVPLALNRYRIDPALATGPFITTTNDILGLFVYFLIGRLMYGFY
ncbi:MAG: magnesium transporter [Bacteroidota bacterium]